MKTSEFELIVAIVNSGFEDNVMETAKNEAASGGTVISASGTAKAVNSSRSTIFHPG